MTFIHLREEQMSERNSRVVINNNGSFGGSYFVTVLGAAVYYIQHATSFGDGAIGLVKALLWPAFVLYRTLELLQM